MGALRLLAGRLAEGVAHHGALLVPARDPRDVALRERALDELVEAVAVALLEGRTLRLPVVGEDDDLVRPGCVAAGSLDVREVVVQLAQGLEGVGALEARVVRDFVVAREGRVDGGPPAHHVGEDARDDQIAHEDAEGRSHERVDAAPVAARAHVAALRAQRCRPLEDDFPAEEDERPRRVLAVGQERPVARVRLLLSLHAADGEDHVLGLAGEEVAAAGAAVHEQADAGGAPPLDLGTIRRRRAGHHRRGLLLHPAEGRDVLVRAQQDPRLAGPRLRGKIGLPFGQAMRVVRQPASHGRGVAVTHRPAEHGQREPVDLEIDDPGDIGAGDETLAARDALRDPDRVRVIRAEDDGEHDADRRDHERSEQGPAEVVDREHSVGKGVGGEEDQGVRDQDEQEAEDERERQSQRGEQGRDDGVQRGDDHRDEERAPVAVDVDAGQDRGGHHQGHARREPRGEERDQPPLGALGLPGRGVAVGLLGTAGHLDFSSSLAVLRIVRCPTVAAIKQDASHSGAPAWRYEGSLWRDSIRSSRALI